MKNTFYGKFKFEVMTYSFFDNLIQKYDENVIADIKGFGYTQNLFR